MCKCKECQLREKLDIKAVDDETLPEIAYDQKISCNICGFSGKAGTDFKMECKEHDVDTVIEKPKQGWFHGTAGRKLRHIFARIRTICPKCKQTQYYVPHENRFLGSRYIFFEYYDENYDYNFS